MNALALFTCVAMAFGNLDASSIAQANGQATESIRSLQVRVKITKVSDPVRGSVVEPNVDYTWAWRGDEQRLRLRRAYIPVQPKTGYSIGCSDYVNGPQGFKGIQNYDPDALPDLRTAADHPAAGVIGPMRPNKDAIGLNPKVQLLLEVPYRSKSFTLAELVKAAKLVEVVRNPTQSKLHCYEVRCALADADYLISVDPDANFMIRKFEVLLTQPNSKKVKASNEVVSFQRFDDNVFLPKELHPRVGEGQSVQSVTTCEMIRVNRDLPSDAFEVNFPEWLTVTDLATGNLVVWGNPTPHMKFKSHDEYLAWAQPRWASVRGFGGRPTTDRGWLSATVAVNIGLLALAAFLARRWYGRRRLAKSPS